MSSHVQWVTYWPDTTAQAYDKQAPQALDTKTEKVLTNRTRTEESVAEIYSSGMRCMRAHTQGDLLGALHLNRGAGRHGRQAAGRRLARRFWAPKAAPVQVLLSTSVTRFCPRVRRVIGPLHARVPVLVATK